jgi:hypothetical protein
MRTSSARAIGLATVGVVGFALASSAADRSENVHFAKGHSSATLKGSITGDHGVVYKLDAMEGQEMSVRLERSSGSCYFNVLPPGSGPEAIFVGSTSGDEFSGTLSASGAYRVQVYQMRATARRKETCRYAITIAIKGDAASSAAPQAKQTGGGAVVSRGNMAAHCRGEASSFYGVKPAYIMTGQITDAAGGGSTIDGTADQGTNGTKRFQCKFDEAGHFVNVMPLDSDGE